MALTIIRPGEPIPVANLRIVWYGDTNVGKTTLALSTSRPLLLDFDTGSHRAIRDTDATIVRIENWDDVRELLADTEFLKQFDTIVLDTVSKCLDYMTADIIKYDPVNGKGGALSQKGWGKLGTMFSAFTHQITTMGKDLVMLSQSREKDRDDSTQVRIKAQGQSAGIIMENSDFCAYLTSRGGKRVISYTFNDDYYAKDVKNTMGSREMPDPEKFPHFGAEMITQMKTAFALYAEVEAQKIQQVQTWTDTINGFSTADEFNQILPEVIKLRANKASIYPQIAAVLLAKREALGIVYDSEQEQFKQGAKPAPKPELPAAITPAQQPVQQPTQSAAPTQQQTAPVQNAVMDF